MNVSKEKREKLVEKINAIKAYIKNVPQDKNTQQLLTFIADIEKDVRGKKYGLVFEEHREAIDKILEDNLPVLTEEKDLLIDNGGEVNFLIEGDNLASLQLLEKTHKGKIDLIYIDPPYNTGNKDFIYDDNIVDSNDAFRHSKWLSFMEKRLTIAKNLLSENGVIFISIDDNEQSQLKMLCSTIFGEDDVESMVWRKIGDGDAGAGKMKITYRFRIEHEYILACYKNKTNILFKKVLALPNFKNEYNNPDNDPRGPYKAGNISKDIEKSNPNGKNYYEVVSPIGQKFSRQWHFDKPTFDKLNKDKRIYWGKNLDAVPSVKIFINEPRLTVPISIIENMGSATTGNKFIESLFGKIVFNNAKPVKLLQYLIERIGGNDFTILDFFAGSGTTGHAVMKLNAEDGGNRKFILCTNSENNICREVTYERIKRVIAKENYHASLKYMKVDYLPIKDKLYYEYADELLKHVKELVELENAIDFTHNHEIDIILTDNELDDFIKNYDYVCQTVYLGHDVLPNPEQEVFLNQHNIEINLIPEYYYHGVEG